jgi:protein-S-isoprenylcysteine O-methyltransferase Ste14
MLSSAAGNPQKEPSVNLFDEAMFRFGTSGTLLLLYGLTEGFARRGGAGSDRPGVPPPRWLKPASFVAISAFYLLIAPTGGALAGGWGNLMGIALAAVAMALRFAVRRGVPSLRHPTVAVRMVFYAALPLAVGVVWGWLVLTAPALLMSAWCSVREDRILCERLGASYADVMSRTHRWVPRMW